MGSGASSRASLPDRLDIAATRTLVEAQSFAFGVRWLDGFDKLKAKDGTIASSELLGLADKYCARHAGDAVRQQLAEVTKSDLSKIIPDTCREEELNELDFKINTLQWSVNFFYFAVLYCR